MSARSWVVRLLVRNRKALQLKALLDRLHNARSDRSS